MSEWIEHDGNGCPVGPDVRVDVRWDYAPENLSFCANTGDPPVEGKYVAGWSNVTHYRIVEPEAHMMSAPITVREPCDPVDTVTISMDEYVLLISRPRDRQIQDCVVSDLCEQVRTAEAERDALRAEVERLRDKLERLRKGKDEAVSADEKALRVAQRENNRMEMETELVYQRRDLGAKLSLATEASDRLDHRLGTQQPDGEPCEPMSQRKPYRWGSL